jgi:hypothetical protein
MDNRQNAKLFTTVARPFLKVHGRIPAQQNALVRNLPFEKFGLRATTGRNNTGWPSQENEIPILISIQSDPPLRSEARRKPEANLSRGYFGSCCAACRTAGIPAYSRLASVSAGRSSSAFFQKANSLS